jgi:hypothetical protein
VKIQGCFFSKDAPVRYAHYEERNRGVAATNSIHTWIMATFASCGRLLFPAYTSAAPILAAHAPVSVETD